MTRSVLITGAANGLGLVISRHLWQQGYQVAMADVNFDAVTRSAQEIDPSQQRLLPLELDIRQPQQFSDALAQIRTRFGELDVLVNNAALTLTTPIMEIDVEEFDRVTSTNLRGTFVGCQTIGRYFSQRQQGSIINLASLAGQNGGTASGAHYAASKGGIITLTKVFARALSNAGVSVNAIAPGPLDLPSVRAAVPEEKMPALLEMIPMKRLGDPLLVARAVELLAAPSATFITGATWDINGGIYMR
ncbi:TPA: SDR family oxidoreductase [Klebsiella aerogenes]|mgnify:FL=1|uniref:SDR family NAD(P)-dependent oxidoreductase n=1 Tax=Klebsiella aerogenes TaxID=548 RepID=UPI00063CC2DF|nr:SDR family oxidoreductase [Klebsiella aerogenes]EKU4512343.1 SDR family oxidoreductase [Klebsiella aerogenes]EKU6671066.1 SDR family oxidoreductase [Klebsiella aerogenes]EMF0802778.1 SDR family oxidoreductase [Klebsiella aerogenes]KLF56090.1 3-oxoacyl-ACP reductase [Klebsiella aerogenes]MBK0622008.1 SDR family oxidoreductase [Klebsiella aerogenes]